MVADGYSSPVQWWDDFLKWLGESGALANAVGGLIAALILGLIAVIPKLRAPTVAAIRRAWTFIISIRVTTTTHIEAATKEAQREGASAVTNRITSSLRRGQTALQEGSIGTSPEPTRIDIPTLAKMDQPRLQPWPEHPALTEKREPVSWSARLRTDGEFVLTNLSRTDAAYHVSASIVGLVIEDDRWPVLTWDEIGPKQIGRSEAKASRDHEWVMEPKLTVVWEDEDGRARREHLEILGG